MEETSHKTSKPTTRQYTTQASLISEIPSTIFFFKFLHPAMMATIKFSKSYQPSKKHKVSHSKQHRKLINHIWYRLWTHEPRLHLWRKKARNEQRDKEIIHHIYITNSELRGTIFLLFSNSSALQLWLPSNSRELTTKQKKKNTKYHKFEGSKHHIRNQ
mgnify:CR=1 FL=1